MTNDICLTKVRWNKKWDDRACKHGKYGFADKYPVKHAFDHGAPPKGDYCYWCGIHKNGQSYAKWTKDA